MVQQDVLANCGEAVGLLVCLLVLACPCISDRALFGA
jgi:hypothetical protein